MRIRDVMTSDVETCRPDTDLATVVRMMWDRDHQGLGPDAKEIVSTLAAICVHRTLTPGTPGTPAVA